MIFAEVSIFIFLLFLVGIILLQIFLSRRTNRWPGLVLPGISFLFSLIAMLSVAALPGSGTREIIATLMMVFLLYNIPTAVLLLIYFACRERFRSRREIDRMSAQDLE